MQIHTCPKWAIGVIVCILALTSVLTAQTSRGTVTGVVTDPSGAVVVNAKLTLIHTDTGVARETQTNSAGIYRFDAVNLGSYTLKVTASGFALEETSGVEVRANQTAGVDFQLKVGTSQQVVKVEAAGAAVGLQTDEQLRGVNIAARAVADLPISGQNSLNLMLTVPGIIRGGTGYDQGIGSVNGSRSRANSFMIDGVDNNDISVTGPTVTLTNNDAVQEVSIQTANYSAEFGRTGGAVVNQITKSGTNNLHGTAAWVYRSEVFNASTNSQRIAYFGKVGKKLLDPTLPDPVLKPAWKEHIPAFTIGGPVYIPGLYNGKNKTFWFAAGQWDHYNSGGSIATFTVPTAAGAATLQSLAASGCSNAALYLKALNGMTADSQTGVIDISIPSGVPTAQQVTCNGTNRAGMTVPYGTGSRFVPDNQPSYNLNFRVDHVISSKQNVSMRFYQDMSSSPNYYTGISRPFDATGVFDDRTASINHTYVISNTMTNELRLNWFRMNYDWQVVDAVGLGSLPTFSFTSLSGFGTSSNYPQHRSANTYQLQDAVTKIQGRHQFRFGGEVFDQIALQLAPFNYRGSISYSTSGSSSNKDLVNGFANFLDDFSGPGSSKVSRLYGIPWYHPSYMAFAVYFQDNWKIKDNFSLNLGLRYDNFGMPANVFKYPAVSMDPNGFSTAKLPSDNNNFGPTVGFAYSPKFGPFSAGKTVIRGGFQIGYDRFFNNLLSNIAANPPNNPGNVPVNCSGSCTGRGLANLYSVQFPGMVNAGTLPINDTSSQFTTSTRNPYTERWSLGIQHELPAGMILDTSYVGSASHKLFQQLQLNPMANPKYDATKGLFGYTAGPRINALLGSRVVRDSTANSNYNALQAELKKRMTSTPLGGAQFSVAYTWSHTLSVIDEVFGTNQTGTAYMSANPLLYNGFRNADYGNADMDRRHRIAATFVWDVRGPKKGILGQAFGGWTVSGVFGIQSGSPISVWDGADLDLDGSNIDRPGIGNIHQPLNTMAERVNSSVCSTGWRSIATGPGWGPCVTPNDVYWLYYPAGSYVPWSSTTAARNGILANSMRFDNDANFIKKFKIREGMSLEYRAEIFNLANHQSQDVVPNNITLSTMFNNVPKDKSGVPTGPSTTKFMDYSQLSLGNRTMRMGLKFIF